MRIHSISLLLLLTSGCGGAISPYARATAGRIGCPAGEIDLDQIEQDGRGPASWVAYCGQSAYACSSSGSIESGSARVVCSEVGRPPRSGYAQTRYGGWR